MPPRSLFPFMSGPDARTATLQNLMVAALVVGALYIGRDVLMPLALAILLAFVLTPPLVFLRRLAIPRAVGVALLVTAAFAVVLGLGWLISQQAAELAQSLPTYQTTLSEKIASLRKSTAESPMLKEATGALKHLQDAFSNPPQNAKPGAESPTAGPAETPSHAPKPIPVEVVGNGWGVLAVYQELAGTLLPPLATTGIVFLFLIFILMQREDLRDRAIRLLGASDLQRATAAMNDAAERLSSYFLRQTMINAAYGIFIALGLWLIGLPTPAVWGILAGLMRFVPYIGSYVAAALPVLLAAAVDPGWQTSLMTLGLFLLSEPIMGQVVEPYIYGRGTGLSPVAVVVSTVFWTWLWGPLGLILAMPITVCLVVLGSHVEGLHFFELMLGDEPALSPEQSFYQRVLTGDAAEATYQAEIALKGESLQSYLDTVAMPALLLAQHDAVRGALDDAEIAHIGETVKEVVANLSHFAPRRWFASLRRKSDDEDDEEPEEGLATLLALEDDAPAEIEMIAHEDLPEDWRVETPVLCIAGRNGLDEAAAAMLAALLTKRGLAAEERAPDALSAANIATLAQSGARIVCLSYFGAGASPAPLRYRIMRLRHILPKGCIILLGHWLEQDQAEGNATAPREPDAATELKLAAGADAYVSTLPQAVDFCLGAAREASARDKGRSAAKTPEAAAAP